MTGPYEQILIPTDGSEATAAAVDVGLDMAHAYDATLHALYIVEQYQPVGYGAAITVNELLEDLERQGERATTEIAARATEREIETITAVRRGTPRTDILTYAADHDIDLIVMGTHGRTGVKRVMIGSVTETVVRHSPIPVLTVRKPPATAE